MSFQAQEFRSPESILHEKPLLDSAAIQESRIQFNKILEKKDARFVIILGPCSIDDPHAALDYAQKVAELQAQVESQFLLVMRVYLEKPRTSLGWTGFLNEPHQNYNPLEGILQGRQLLLSIHALRVPIATEFLSPFTAPYISDLITWGCIGARTSVSAVHRQLAAISPMPVGFKNTLEGCFNAPVNGILFARKAQTVMGIGPNGRLSLIQTKGNPYCHLVLRGGTLTGPNYDIPSLKSALLCLENANLPQRLLIDCSHHNSGKNHKKQIEIFQQVMHYREKGLDQIFGCMIESYLVSGHQNEPLNYGQSLTDPCLGWEETKQLILAYAKCTV